MADPMQPVSAVSSHDSADTQSSSHELSSSRATSNNNLSSPRLQPARRSPTIQPLSQSTHSLSSTSSGTLPAHRKELSVNSSPSVSKRSSYAENLRNYPTSPRNQRTHSFSGQALQELLMHPSKSKQQIISDNAKYAGRDWRSIQVADIIDPEETRFVEADTSVEDCTKLLCRSGAPNVVLVRESTQTKTAIDTFDYTDLNAYLLLVLGMIPAKEKGASIVERARQGEAIPLRDLLSYFGTREPPVALPHTANLKQAMVVLGSGNHRVIIHKEGTTEAIGVLSQLRLVRFFWENHNNFSATERLYAVNLKELELGTKEVVAIQGERPLSDALRLMYTQGITSLPVLDAHRNVVGNISHVDVRLLTDTSAIPLLSSSCLHFIGIILSERGLQEGKDAYPVFHVTPFSTLAHTVAKLCATRSHRMWIVDAPSPSPSILPSPAPGQSAHTLPPLSLQPAAIPHTPLPSHSQPHSGTPTPPHSATNSTVGKTGRLSGVVSLTDVLNLFARASGLSPGDPEVARRRRRQSSSSSMRPSFDNVRPSQEALREAFSTGGGSGGASSASTVSADEPSATLDIPGAVVEGGKGGSLATAMSTREKRMSLSLLSETSSSVSGVAGKRGGA